MTPKQKQAKIKSIEAILNACGFKQDSYGNWLNQLDGIKYRAKLKKINLRLERKSTDRWLNIKSQPISSLDMADFTTWAAKFIN